MLSRLPRYIKSWHLLWLFLSSVRWEWRSRSQAGGRQKSRYWWVMVSCIRNEILEVLAFIVIIVTTRRNSCFNARIRSPFSADPVRGWVFSFLVFARMVLLMCLGSSFHHINLRFLVSDAWELQEMQGVGGSSTTGTTRTRRGWMHFSWIMMGDFCRHMVTYRNLSKREPTCMLMVFSACQV